MKRILDRINEPKDLRSLSVDELQRLAAEARELIVNTVSQTGGHLAPNLGVVELTIALHRVFEAPRDKIIWDVGHQCYVHKILTGRREAFPTLRKYGGLSGFPSRFESEYDVFGTGHSSTSISAALGMALGRDYRADDDSSVVAVIGDGALTAGMAFEALNHAGHMQRRLVVVLNDNEMSIAKNVGALSGYLTRLRTDPMYTRGKEELEELLQRIPAIGPRLLKWTLRVKDSLKYLVVPGMIFEELGFTYLGPVDGHNIPQLLNILKKAKAAEGPVIVHVLTTKGKGYKPAETNPDKFHGVGAFDVETGKVKKSGRVTYTEVFGRTLLTLAQEDERIVAITAAMTSGTGLAEFAKTFPDRFFDVGIAEQHAVTLAAGMAAEGLRPVVAIYSTFMQRAFDQVVHDVCLQRLPVVMALDRGGIVGDDGPTHQGIFDLSYLRLIPNLTVMAPRDENELQHMLKAAVDYRVPVAVRYPRGTGTGCPLDQDFREIPLGRAEVLREGRDATILAVGNTVEPSLKAAEMLAAAGIKAAVINARFVKPLDEECILTYARRSKQLFVVEENVVSGGFGAAVLELLAAKRQYDVHPHLIALPDAFLEHGSPSILREKYGLNAKEIAEKVRVELQRSRLRLAPTKI
ncbi:1-deoxy-D-xylulose-5-phosphate synthase [Desulforudis sp. 1088]|uniref:1-deoxy-D-xylulose-5-phosphate synthase n=1 Tax=Desulforudis sp. Tu-874 TaxID=3416276 RepID=UPI003CE4846C